MARTAFQIVAVEGFEKSGRNPGNPVDIVGMIKRLADMVQRMMDAADRGEPWPEAD